MVDQFSKKQYLKTPLLNPKLDGIFLVGDNYNIYISQRTKKKKTNFHTKAQAQCNWAHFFKKTILHLTTTPTGWFGYFEIGPVITLNFYAFF